MATTQDYAALALYVYDVRRFDINRPQLPTGWTLAEPLHRDDLLGFSYGVFRSPSGEIVLSYAGTNEIIGDWASNLIAAVGLVPAPQLVAAAKAYLDVKAAHGANITLSGHSLDGGLASVVATWFDRPAVVFDAAPFQLSAQSPTVWTLTGAVLGLAGYSDTAFDRAIFDFAIREQQVAHHYLDGEALMLLRASLPVIAGSETPLQVGGLGLNPVQLHSMALYTVAKLSLAFMQATYVSQRILPLILAEQGFMAGHAGQDRTRERIELKRDLITQRARSQEAIATLRETQNATAAYVAEVRRTLYERSAQADLRRQTATQEQTKATQREKLTTLTAPVAGKVQQLAVHTAGGVVTEAQALMVIVPDGAPVTAEVTLDNKDIGFVNAGQAAEIKLETFPYTRYGTIAATVTRVSADAVNDEKRGALFPVTLAMAVNQINIDGKPIRLAPGMNVTAEIKTGKRRVIDYLLSPVQRAGSESLRER